MTIRMIAHIGKPLDVGAGGVGILDAAVCAVFAAASAVLAAELAAELAVELEALAALETVDAAVWVAPAAAAPRPARSPEAPSALESSGGSAAEMALF